MSENFSALLMIRRSGTQKLTDENHILNSNFILSVYTDSKKESIFALIGEKRLLSVKSQFRR
jgi:hypothetical protein